MKKTLYPYQKEGISEIIDFFKSGSKRVVFQLPTGGGKTLTASALINLFHKQNKSKDILFFVHRKELLEQFKRTYEKQYEDAEVGIIDAKSRMKRFDLKIHVCMVESAINRLKRNPNWFGNNVGLLVIDECHNAGFDKIFGFFPDTLTVGLTATPTRLSKKNLMRLVYDDIVSTTSISELIEFGSLSPNKTFCVDNKVNYTKLKKSAGDYSKGSIFEEYSKTKHITNVVKAYEQICLGKKTMIFNASIEHSKLVNAAFNSAGYKSMHLDGTTKEREMILRWFSETPGAILQNVAVLTMGYDEPSIESVIMNRPTLSLPLWKQCTGRGSRIYPGKPYFTIIDLGDNVYRHGDWSFDVDWKDMFYNSKLKDDTDGVAPIKTCPECFFIMPVQTMTCPECEYQFGTDEIEENTEELKLKLVTDNFAKKVNVHKINNFVEKRKWNEYTAVHLIKEALIRQIRSANIKVRSNEFNALYAEYMKKVHEWGKENEKSISFLDQFAPKILKDELKRLNLI